MKNPRTLTPEEEALWQEANRLTKQRKTKRAGQKAIPDTPAVEKPAKAQISSSAIPKASSQSSAVGNKPPLAPLTPREAKRAFKPHGMAEAVLDLHGMGKLDAYDAVARFLSRARRAGMRHVAIITGKGRAGAGDGLLRRELPHWLNEPRLREGVSAFTHAAQEKGGSGVTHVLLKRL